MFMLQAGMYASAMEHSVLEQITGVESVSTMKILGYASENNIPIHMIDRENLSDELDLLNISDQVKQEISTSVNSGKLVIIPEQDITINQWSGIGYMVLDTETFACGYMISGGLAGGSLTWWQVISEYAIYVVLGVVFGILMELIASVIVTGWVGVLFSAFKVILMLTWILQLIDLYMQWEATGEPIFLQELLIQLAAGVTVYGIFKFSKLNAKIQEFIEWSNAHPIGGGGTCFIEGTPILTPSGLVPIETIKSGDAVLSFNPETQEISQQLVEEAFIHRNDKLINIDIGSETITATPEHPFYIPQKGFVNAIDLRAGDTLWTVNGEYVIIEKIQHEIIESPVKVYNFRVANNHTYFVGNASVGVHNKNNGTIIPEQYKPTEELKNHIIRGNGKTPTSKKPNIDGAHNANEFYKLVEKFGCKIVSETNLSDGVSKVGYKLPLKDKAGNIIPGQWKSDTLYKTIYDPSIISDEVFIQRGIEAFNNWKLNNPDISSLPRAWESYDNDGILWRGYFDSNGNLSSYFPIDE